MKRSGGLFASEPFSLYSKKLPGVSLWMCPWQRIQLQLRLLRPGEVYNKSMNYAKLYPNSWLKPNKQQIKIRLHDGQCSSDLLQGAGVVVTLDQSYSLKYKGKTCTHIFWMVICRRLPLPEPLTCEWGRHVTASGGCRVGLCEPYAAHCHSRQ